VNEKLDHSSQTHSAERDSRMFEMAKPIIEKENPISAQINNRKRMKITLKLNQTPKHKTQKQRKRDLQGCKHVVHAPDPPETRKGSLIRPIKVHLKLYLLPIARNFFRGMKIPKIH
jgi:hypothetical protein